MITCPKSQGDLIATLRLLLENFILITELFLLYQTALYHWLIKGFYDYKDSLNRIILSKIRFKTRYYKHDFVCDIDYPIRYGLDIISILERPLLSSRESLWPNSSMWLNIWLNWLKLKARKSKYFYGTVQLDQPKSLYIEQFIMSKSMVYLWSYTLK